MSDDLERAWKELKTGLGVALGGAPAPGPRTPHRTDDWTASPDSGSIDLEALASLTLLSFLDMDEAGVERIARVLIPEGWDDSLLPHATPSDHPAIKVWRASALRQARAVLTELRKMASPTQRDEGE